MAQEALVRGPEAQAAAWVLDQVAPDSLYAFDQACRMAAIEEACRLGLPPPGEALDQFPAECRLQPAGLHPGDLAAADAPAFR